MNKPLHVDRRYTLLAPQGEFELERDPPDPNLQAWDAADELLLAQVADLDLQARDNRTLIVNDSFGALAVALAAYPVYSWNDSWLAQRALAANLRANGYPEDQVRVNRGIDFPGVEFDLVLIRPPKSLALLEHQLYCLRPLLHRGSVILGAAMSRHIHRSTLQLFEAILGPTTTSRARKKARLIFVERDHSLNEGRSPYPDSYTLVVEREYRIVNHASLFSRDRLDAGTRLLIEHMPTDPGFRRIVDLGCGNGVLGIVAADRNPAARLGFYDQSYMALASAETNFDAAFGTLRDAEFGVGDGLQAVADASQDLVLLNPPFHQQHAVGDSIAWRLLRDAHRVLVAGGELRLVGNRHLGYHAKLKKLFGNCVTVAANAKFVVLSARRQARTKPESSPRERGPCQV